MILSKFTISACIERQVEVTVRVNRVFLIINSVAPRISKTEANIT